MVIFFEQLPQLSAFKVMSNTSHLKLFCLDADITHHKTAAICQDLRNTVKIYLS